MRAVGGLEEAAFGAVGAGEGALDVAEERRLDQGLGDGAAVDGDHLLVAARAVGVDEARAQLLAGARLALDQHRHRARGDGTRALEQHLHGRAAADDARFVGGGGRRRSGEVGDSPVGGAQDLRDVLHGDLERQVHIAQTVLAGGVDEVRVVAGLGQQQPHRRHGRSAGAEVEGQLDLGAVFGAHRLDGVDGGLVDGGVVDRARELDGADLEGRARRRCERRSHAA